MTVQHSSAEDSTESNTPSQVYADVHWRCVTALHTRLKFTCHHTHLLLDGTRDRKKEPEATTQGDVSIGITCNTQVKHRALVRKDAAQLREASLEGCM